MEDLRNAFNTFKNIDTFQRVDEVHPLDLYVGIDEHSRWTLLLICEERPQKFTSSKMIDAKLGVREDGRWAVSLSLINKDYEDIFLLFCGDIIDSSRSFCDKDKGARFVVKRYLEWKEMLANSRGDLLTASEIKGLLGEMYFLDQELIKTYGTEKAVQSWTGPKALHQDFVLDDTWYEVKTTSSGRDEVKISSVEQLDRENDGGLVIVFADKTSKTNSKALTLNLMYAKLMSQMTDDETKLEFSDTLLKLGYYPRPEYDDDEYTFEVKDVWHYFVNASFPCLRRENLPSEVTQADYFISLPAIKEFREEK